MDNRNFELLQPNRLSQPLEQPESPRLWLREWRQFRGLSQVELSRLAAVDRHTVIALEKPGHRPPWPRTLAKLAAVLGVAPFRLWSEPSNCDSLDNRIK